MSESKKPPRNVLADPAAAAGALQSPADPTPTDPISRLGLKVASRADKVNLKPDAIPLTPDLYLRFHEKTLTWLQECLPDVPVTAVSFVRLSPIEVLIIPTTRGTPDSAPLKFGRSGRTAEVLASLGIYRSDVPLLKEGTVHLNIAKKQLDNGFWCLSMNLKKPRLVKSTPADGETSVKRKKKSNPGAPGVPKKTKAQKAAEKQAAEEAAKEAAAKEAAAKEAAAKAGQAAQTGQAAPAEQAASTESAGSTAAATKPPTNPPA